MNSIATLSLGLLFITLTAHARTAPVSCIDLLTSHRAAASSREISVSQKLVFQNVGGRDVYNPTKPFHIMYKGQSMTVLAARVEARDSEQSEVMFFAESAGVWSPVLGAPIFTMQDPAFTFIEGEFILSGVEIFARPEGAYGYRTIFFRGRSLESLNPKEPFARGPMGMKDIRLVQLGQKIGLFTRPQGLIPGTNIDAGPGKIGFTVINSIAELTEQNIIKAPLLEDQFAAGEWGGVNEAQVLPDGKIGVLAHIARFDAEKNRHYYSAIFTVDPISGIISPLEVILERKDLSGGLAGHSKREDLKDVIFSGGYSIDGNSLIIYVGAGDAETHSMSIKLPGSFKP